MTIEKAARACYEYDFNGPTAPKWHVMKDREKEPFRKRAIAILETTLEPSDEEVEAAIRAFYRSETGEIHESLYPLMRAALRAARLVSLGR